jgi:predicted house-cleaning noncanonical NTP pyrophosphatase (MazG superfamily)
VKPEKLIRDKMPELVLAERGEVLETRIASDEEFLGLLKAKIIEEAQEVVAAQTKEDLAEELGDLLEVIKAIAQNQNIVDEMFKSRDAKELKRGTFEKKIVLVKNNC